MLLVAGIPSCSGACTGDEIKAAHLSNLSPLTKLPYETMYNILAPSTSAPPVQQPQPQPTAPAVSGWIIETRAGCLVWDPYPVPNETAIWDGSCTNGFAQGYSYLHGFVNSQAQSAELGTMRSGRFEGDVFVGTLTGGSKAVYQNECLSRHRAYQGRYVVSECVWKDWHDREKKRSSAEAEKVPGSRKFPSSQSTDEARRRPIPPTHSRSAAK
jgi:hypothetical protein